MDATYESLCAQVGVPPHPRLLRDLAAFDVRRTAAFGSRQQEVLRLGGPRAARDPPIRDADIVAVCLVVRSLARLVAAPPPVHLDFTDEQVTCEGARTIAAVLQVNCGLHAVSLRRTGVSDEGAAALGAALGGSSLAELDLGECRIGNAGARLLVRGIQMHGTPASLKVLLLDSNPMSDAGVVEIISLVEGNSRPPALSALAVHPAPPNVLSDEVEAALSVVCELCRVELRGSVHGALGVRLGGLRAEDDLSGISLSALLAERHGSEVRSPSMPWSSGPVAEHQLQPVVLQQPAATGGMVLPRRSPCASPSPSPHWWAQASPARGAPGVQTTPDVRAGRSSGHLAAWMAGTERELRELKWLLGASAARLDGQHQRLMGELDKLRAQLDMWARAGSAAGGAAGDEGRLEVLEARFDALEQLLGREQSECAQMWQLVEVAAGAAPSAGPASLPPA